MSDSAEADGPTPAAKPRAADASPRWKALRRPLAIFFAALVVRAVHLVLLDGAHPELIDHPVLDGAHYHRWAQDILAGTGLAKQVFFMHPALPYALAMVYALAGPSPFLAVGLQCLLGAVSAALLSGVVVRLARRESASWAAGLLFAFYQPLVLGDLVLETTSLGIFFWTLSIWLAVRKPGRPLAVAGSGLAFAISALCRASILATVPAVLAMLYFRARGAWTLRLRACLPWIGGLAVVFGVVAWRNHRVGDEWVATNTSFGPVLYLCNYDGAESGLQEPPPWLRTDPAYEEEDYRAEAQRRTGKRLGPSALSAYWRAEAVAVMTAHPSRTIGRMAKKWAMGFGAREVADNYSITYLDSLSPLGRVPLPGFAVVLALAIPGMVLARRHARRLAVLYGTVLLYPLTLALFCVSSRYRIPVVPALIAFAAIAVARAVDWARARDVKRLGILAAAMAALGAGSWLATRHLDADKELPQAMNSHGLVYLAAKEPAEAVRVLSRARELDPTAAVIAGNLGRAALDAKDVAVAIAAYADAARLDPDTESFAVGYAIALARGRRVEEAIASLSETADRFPSSVQARFNLALLRGGAGDVDAACADIERVLALDPDHAQALALAAQCRGEPSEPR